MQKKSTILAAAIMTCCFVTVQALLSCNTASDKYTIDQTMVENTRQLRWERDSTLLVFGGNGTVSTQQLHFSKGKYTIQFKAFGNIGNNILPHFVVMLGDYTVKEINVAVDVTMYKINFELFDSCTAPLKFTFDNDYQGPTEDRNVFLFFPVTIKPY